MTEVRPLVFQCGDEELVGMLHPADGSTGLIVVVGGPQYRVGSHRQFLLLARQLAAHGIPVLRFDCRGMGDSSGDFPGFEGLDDDIRAAVDCLQTQATDVQHVVLWGLCDAASAILLYAHQDPRINGVVLLNPWVRTAAGEARSYVQHYYGQRLLTADFWRRLLRGEVGIAAALGDFLRKLRLGLGGGTPEPTRHGDFVARMRAGATAFAGASLYILSGQDLTAAEFTDLVDHEPAWQQLLARPNTRVARIADANHTFASARWRAQVETLTLDWVRALPETGAP